MFVMTRDLEGSCGEIKGGESMHCGRNNGAIARLDRAIQYSEMAAIESIGRSVLDPPPEPVIGLAEGETRWRG
ncbi:hypothetical protein [Bradyrhizobium betae]|uniref:hypothetical protein n=1 Tax=Bradyrhizobium betae TaxID=244734 RepID=UPI0012B67E1C|nr:hypothetical protein [Bradyrhizobium betae]MCS3729628.1 hypothetical protein [Bradyrhizobium betae]